MSARPVSLSRQINYLTLAFATALLTVLGASGWWAASSIDDRSMARQARAVQRGLADLIGKIPLEQDSSVVWDDAVINLRAGNATWIADNLAEWVSEYYGHDRVYILDPNNQPVRAVAQGKLVDSSAYQDDISAIRPLVDNLRARMAQVSLGQRDSTDTVVGLGSADFVVLGDGAAAVVSVRPVLPSTNAITQVPGTEYLHISARLLDNAVAQEIGARYEITGLAFQPGENTDGDRIASPVKDRAGDVVGYFTWLPAEPAHELIQDTAPVLIGGVVMGGLAVFLLLTRLKRTSTQLEDTKAQASFLAFHDTLTLLPNRALFEDRLEQALANMRSGASRVALHYVDLDHFKQVNDSLGHGAGDDLLRQAAERLSSLVEDVDTVARLGGDEFAVIQFHAEDTAAALTLSQRIVDVFTSPIALSGREGRVSASVGVTVVTDALMSIEDIMREADVALYEAKNAGRGRYCAYDGELNAAVRDRRDLELDLRDALNGDAGLHLLFQPIFDARSGLIAGAEALVRWQHPTRGPLSPTTFIGLAEERGLIDPLGLWVMRQACSYAASSALPWVAVNASPIQFRDEKFADRVFEILGSTGLQPRRLEIEITEGLLLQNSSLIQSTLMRLRASGIRIALDDFGTGYSSISYLRSHGIDKLKIDQSYTAQLGQDFEIDGIVRSIVDLAHATHMAVTAEGVETESQRAILKGMGCGQLQGFLMSRPVSSALLDQMLGSAAPPAERHLA